MYAWDNIGRLKTMTCKTAALPAANVTAETVSFIYDADDRRTDKIVRQYLNTGKQDVTESKLLWAGSLPVLEVQLHNGALVRKRWFQWGPDLSGTLEGAGGIGGLEAIIEEPVIGTKRTLLPVQDGLGNITAVFNAATGQMVARYDYGPFGETLRVSGEADACPFRWQTRWYDGESGHYYFLHRYYDPRLGRWLSRDPIGEAGGFNLYAYCGNDPVNRHDPLGLSTKLNIDGSVEFYDDGFNSRTELLQIAALVNERNGLDAQREKLDRSKLRGLEGYDPLIRRQQDGLETRIRSETAEINYRITADLTSRMSAEDQKAFLQKAYGNSFNQWSEFYTQEVQYGDQPSGLAFRLGATTKAIEPYLAGLAGFVSTLPLGGEGAVPVAAESETSILTRLKDNAVARFETESFTPPQQRALINNPELEAAYRGHRIDAFFKEAVVAHPDLKHLEITPSLQVRSGCI